MTDTYRAKRVSLQVWIDADTRKELKQLALDESSSVTDLVAEAVELLFTNRAQAHGDVLMEEYRERTRRHQEFIRVTGGPKIG